MKEGERDGRERERGERERERARKRKRVGVQAKRSVRGCMQTWRCARDSALKYLTILPKLPYENSTSSVAFSMKLGVGISTVYYYNIYKNQ